MNLLSLKSTGGHLKNTYGYSEHIYRFLNHNSNTLDDKINQLNDTKKEKWICKLLPQALFQSGNKDGGQVR